MFTHPLTFMPLAGLALALAWSAWRPGPAAEAAVLAFGVVLVASVAGAARAQRRTAALQVTQLGSQVAEQKAALALAEARGAALEADLRALEQRYVLALRGSQDGLWEWDLASDAVHLSPRWKGMLGYPSDALADSRGAWRERIHPQDRAGFDAALARHLDGRDGRVDHTMRLVHRDGSVRHVLTRAVAIGRDDGSPGRLVGMDTDVTRLARVQAVLDAVADGTAGAYGERFFATMVEHFARALEVDCAFIAECLDHPATRVRTLAYWSSADGHVANFEFALAGTPCEAVVTGGRTCFLQDGLAHRFPREAGYEAYLGMPIIASDGRILGHLALRHRHPLAPDVLVERVYRIFLGRAAVEMELMQARTALACARSAA